MGSGDHGCVCGDRCVYTVWLKKHNYLRVEASHSDGRLAGTIVGDGATLGLFWAGDRPQFSVEDQETYDITMHKTMEHSQRLS